MNDGTETMIRLEALTKRFPGSDEPAVEALTMDIPEGEIVVLVGPSGCGKTTTMKLINRLIEPTSGRIFLGGDDVTKANPDHLRRRIGYVIQQIGLFPHMTIADNIATVPRLLQWPAEKIDRRVDELLDLVGMDPSQYRARYPKELSGGQRQRVGVARALSADPPVMLMDEPFGAIDPITRERLQNEFLRIQEELRKTIVFVTHDIDEAIKIGDRIAVLRNQSVIAQYDTPMRILSDPADDYVAEFIGSGAALKRLGLATVRDHKLAAWPTAHVGDEPAELERVLREAEHDVVLLLDDRNQPLRWLEADHVGRTDAASGRVGLPVEELVEPTATLAEALSELVTSQVGCVVVVDERGAYRGTLDMPAITAAAKEMRRAQQAEAAASRDGSRPEEVTP